jgi:hypothetical protein
MLLRVPGLAPHHAIYLISGTLSTFCTAHDARLLILLQEESFVSVNPRDIVSRDRPSMQES